MLNYCKLKGHFKPPFDNNLVSYSILNQFFIGKYMRF